MPAEAPGVAAAGQGLRAAGHGAVLPPPLAGLQPGHRIRARVMAAGGGSLPGAGPGGRTAWLDIGGHAVRAAVTVPLAPGQVVELEVAGWLAEGRMLLRLVPPGGGRPSPRPRSQPAAGRSGPPRLPAAGGAAGASPAPSPGTGVASGRGPAGQGGEAAAAWEPAGRESASGAGGRGVPPLPPVPGGPIPAGTGIFPAGPRPAAGAGTRGGPGDHAAGTAAPAEVGEGGPGPGTNPPPAATGSAEPAAPAALRWEILRWPVAGLGELEIRVGWAAVAAEAPSPPPPSPDGRPRDAGQEGNPGAGSLQPGARPHWHLELSWVLPRTGRWHWRLSGQDRRVALSLAVEPALAALLSGDGQVAGFLAGLLAQAGFEPAGVRIAPHSPSAAAAAQRDVDVVEREAAPDVVPHPAAPLLSRAGPGAGPGGSLPAAAPAPPEGPPAPGSSGDGGGFDVRV